MSRPVIGLSGLAKSGKSTVADHLVERHGFVRVKFSGPLKDMLRAIGLTERHIEGDLKELPCDLLCGASPRKAMLLLGTEFGRDLISPDLWTTLWRSRCDAVPECCGIVADDVRFHNEVAAARALSPSATVLRIERSEGTATINHRSEAMAFDVDMIVHNDGTIEELQANIDAIVAWLVRTEKAA